MKKVRKIIRGILFEADLFGQQSQDDLEADLRDREQSLETDVEDLENKEKFFKGLDMSNDTELKNKLKTRSNVEGGSDEEKTANRKATEVRIKTLKTRDQEFMNFKQELEAERERKQKEIETLQQTGAKTKIAKGEAEMGDTPTAPDVPIAG